MTVSEEEDEPNYKPSTHTHAPHGWISNMVTAVTGAVLVKIILTSLSEKEPTQKSGVKKQRKETKNRKVFYVRPTSLAVHTPMVVTLSTDPCCSRC